MNKFGFVCLLTVLMTGCSVKEVRDECPCHLILDFSQVDTLAVAEALISAADELGTVYGGLVSAKEFMPEYHMDVMRSRLHLNVCSGDAGLYRPGKGLAIPEGEACPEIWIYSAGLEADSESVRDTVMLRKNHCVLTLVIEKEDSPVYGLRVKGNVNGYGVDGSPVEGTFSCIPEEAGKQRFRTVIPRQTDPSLMLEVDDGTEILKSIALGELISAGGYDWTSPDLEDLTVHIDWAFTDVVITVRGWNWSRVYQIVI